MKTLINNTKRYQLGIIISYHPDPTQALHVFPPARVHWEAAGPQGAGAYIVKQEHFPVGNPNKIVGIASDLIEMEFADPYDEDDEEEGNDG